MTLSERVRPFVGEINLMHAHLVQGMDTHCWNG